MPRTIRQSSPKERDLIGRGAKTRSRTTSRRSSAADIADVETLVWFLNTDATAKKSGKPISLRWFSPPDSVEKFISLQTELIDDLTPIARGRDRDFLLSRGMQKSQLNQLMDFCGRRLFSKAQRFGITLKLVFSRYLPPKARKNHPALRPCFRVRDCEWSVEADYDLDPLSYREVFYEIICSGLWSGELFKLRCCPGCGLYFLANEARQTFCRPEHGRQYHDRKDRAEPRRETWQLKRSAPAENSKRSVSR